MLKKVSTLIIKHKWLSMAIILLISGIFSYEIRNMYIRTDISDLYPPDHPFIKVHNEYKDTLGSPFKILVMLKVKDGDIYNTETLSKVIRINDALDAIPGVNHNSVYSLASRKMKKIKHTEFGVEAHYLMQEVPTDIEQFKFDVRTAPGVYGVWVSLDEKSVLFAAGFIEHLMDYDAIFQTVNQIVESESNGNHELFTAGDPVLMGWVNYYQEEIIWIFGITFAAFVVLLWLFFRNALGVIVHIPPIILGVVWFLGYAGLLGYNVEPLTLVIPILIVARSLSHSVQFTERYFEIYHKNGQSNVDEACIETMTCIIPPGLLGLVTDGLGILLIAVAPVPMMQKLAYLCGFWAFSNILTGLVFTPVFIALSASWHPKNVDKLVAMDEGIIQKSLGLLAKMGHGRAGVVTFIVTILLTVFTGYHASKVAIGDIHSGSSLLWGDSFFNKSITQINNNFPGTEELYIIVEGKGERPLENPGFLRVLNSFQRYMEECPDVGRTLSVADLLPRMYRSIYDGHPKWETFPQNKREGYQLFSKLTASSAPGDYDLYFARDGSFANVIIWYKDHKGDTLRNAVKNVEKYIEEKKDFLARENCTIKMASGNLGVLAAVNATVEDSQLLNFLLVMGVVFVLCSLTYRSIAAAVILLIPLNITNIITLAIMRWLDIGLNINTLPVVSVGVGVGIDYGIYLLSRICEEYQTAGGIYTAHVATRAVKTTGKAIFFTASTMIVGVIFWYLLSNMKFQAEMGLLLAIIMFINIFAALVLIPTIVNIFRPSFLGKVRMLASH